MILDQATLLFLITAVSGQVTQKTTPQFFAKNAVTCDSLSLNPYFDMEQVIGNWRIYYTWNMKIDQNCLDMTFSVATPKVIQRIWNEMGEYLETQPYWDSATLHVTMGKTKHEILLFADQGAAGKFTGVPNALRDGNNIAPERRSVPLFKLQMKMVQGEKFLVMMDCLIGVVSISARPGEPPDRKEIESCALELNLDDGFPACFKENRTNEQFFI